MNDLTTAVPCDRCCTRLHRSIRSSPNGSSSNRSFPSDSHVTHHQICTCSTHLSSCHHCVAAHSQNYALSKHPSRYRRGSARSSHESMCCHRDHSSKRQSTFHDSHTCPRNCSSCHALDFLDVPVSSTDRAITHWSHSHDTPVSHTVCSGAGLGYDAPVSHNVCLKLHRSPCGHTLSLAIHQHSISRNFLSLARRCLAALAEGVNTLFNGPDCGRCSTFTWLRKLSSTTSGSTPSSSSFCRRASIRMRFLTSMYATRMGVPLATAIPTRRFISADFEGSLWFDKVR